MTWTKEAKELYEESLELLSEANKNLTFLHDSNTKARQKIDERWEEIEKIQGKFSRDDYLKIYTKFSNENLTSTALIDESLNNLYYQINEIQINIKKIRDWNVDNDDLKDLEDETTRLRSMMDNETKKNDLNRAKFHGIGDYLRTIQGDLSDQRMENIAEEQRKISKETHSIAESQQKISKETHNLAKSQRNIAIAIGAVAVVSLIATFMILGLTEKMVELSQDMVDESRDTTDILTALDRNNELMLASLYSDYELEIEYVVGPFRQSNTVGGTLYDLTVKNYGQFDALVTTKIYLREVLCDEDGNHFYLERIPLIKNAKIKSDVIEGKDDTRYHMEIPKIYSNYTNLMPFTIEIWTEGSPVTPDGEPIEYFTKDKIARVHYVFSDEMKNWVPDLGWTHLDCFAEPRQDSSFLKLDTANDDHFE